MKLPEPELFDGVTLGNNGKFKATVNGYTESQMRQAIKDATESQAAEIERLRDCLEYAYKIFGNRGTPPKLMEVMAWLAMTESAMKENKHD